MPNKPLTYNRFRAYLRIKLKNQHFSQKRFLFAIFFYFLCSLTLFLLPYNILTLYPYLKVFTDFMDFIPAIKLMESKTFAPELCKFYAAYMFVVGVVCLIETSWQLFISYGKYPRKGEKELLKRFNGHPIKEVSLMIIWYIMVLFYIYDFLNGGLIGFALRRDSSDYFIYSLFDIILYIDFWQAINLFIAWSLLAIPNVIYSVLFYFRLYNK